MMQLRPIDWVPVLCFGLLPLSAVFVHKGTVILFVILGAAASVSLLRRRSWKMVFPPKLMILAGVGIGWLIVASLVSPDTLSGLRKIGQICVLAALLFPALAFLSEADSAVKQAAIGALMIGVSASLVILLAGYIAIGAVDQNLFVIERVNKLSILYPGFVVVALLFPSVLGYLQKTGRRSLLWGIALVALALSIVIGAVSSTVLISFTIITFAFFRKDPWQLPKVLALVLVVVTITLPVAMPLVLDRIAVVFIENNAADAAPTETAPASGSIEHRYQIWRFAADRAAERPFLGWGFNASRSLPGGHALLGVGTEILPLHPHNAVLQVWLELGVPGLLLLCILLWRSYLPPGWQAMKRRELFIRTQTITVIFIAASTTFGIWQSWWLASIALVMASTSLWHEQEGKEVP